MAASTVYFGDLLTTLDRMGLAGQLTVRDRTDEVAKRVSQIAAAFGLEWQIPQPSLPPPEDLQPVPQKEPPPPAPVEDSFIVTPESEKLEFWTVLRKRTRVPEELDQPPEELRNVPPAPADKWTFRGDPLRGAPLMPWSRLWPFLRRVLGRERSSRSPDLPRLVCALAQGRPLHRLPQRQRSAWCPEVTLLVDRRTAMSPFLDDFDDIIARIRTLRGAGGLRVIAAEADARGLLFSATLEPLTLPRDVSSTALMALGDLGQYAGGALSHAWISWGRKARNAGFTPWALCPCPQDRWLPAVAQTWNAVCWDRHSRPPQDGGGHRALPWAADEQESVVKLRSQQLHHLFCLVSPAVRVERGFLRDVRFLLDHAAADAGTEYDAFQSPDAIGSGEGLSLIPTRQRELRSELGQVAQTILAEMLRLLKAHHTYSASVFGAEELDGLRECLPVECHPLLEQCGLLTTGAEAQAALHWRQMAAGLLEGRFGRHQEAMKKYALRGISRVGATIADSAPKQVIWALGHPEHEGEYPGHIAPDTIAFLQKRNRTPSLQTISVAGGLRVGALPPHDKIPLASLYTHWQAASVAISAGDGSSSRKLLWHWQDAPVLSEAELKQTDRVLIDAGVDAVELGKLQRPSWASRLWYQNEALKAQFTFNGQNHIFESTWVTEVEMQSASLFYHETGWQAFDWACKSPPSWATRLWVDNFGLAAEFRIRSVPFALRWIPPGSFLMGSPEGEAGRQENEGPQHEVRISKGFWMGETPVTQDQWRAVVEAAGEQPGLIHRLLGKKTLDPAPSHFQGPGELPVEKVSWDDSGLFCELLGALLPDGPGFRLPSEAQWEYACRAGTQTALYSGEIDILGENNAPALDHIAWYGGNSGLDLEVTNPEGSNSWPKKQYDHQQAGTHRVKLKQANPWGLYDTIGNVCEWCRDPWDAKAYAKRPTGIADPETPATDKAAFRVLRGGSWINLARYCRAAFRDGVHPGSRWDIQGLRLSAGQELAEPQEKERSDLPERRSRARRAASE